MTPTLDSLIERARTAEVRDDGHVVVAELARWADRRPAPARWPGWSPWAGGAALAAAAALIALVVWPRGAARRPGEPVQLGGRVAIVTAPGTAYRVARAGDASTEVVVLRGAVTARLWPGEAPHRLTLRGGDVIATATGTVYTLAVDGGGAVVRVHEGTVQVRTGDDERSVAAGASWPSAGGAVGEAAAAVLLAWAPAAEPAGPRGDPPGVDLAPDHPLDPADARDGGEGGTALDDERDAPGRDGPRTGGTSIAPDGGAPGGSSLTERWRRARLLRGQGHFDQALAACVAIGDERDPTWSPIALLEASRIALDALADPATAEALARRVEAEWPSHALVPEARAVACRALTLLGRAADCH